jgi:hypothetical protein
MADFTGYTCVSGLRKLVVSVVDCGEKNMEFNVVGTLKPESWNLGSFQWKGHSDQTAEVISSQHWEL